MEFEAAEAHSCNSRDFLGLILHIRMHGREWQNPTVAQLHKPIVDCPNLTRCGGHRLHNGQGNAALFKVAMQAFGSTVETRENAPRLLQPAHGITGKPIRKDMGVHVHYRHVERIPADQAATDCG